MLNRATTQPDNTALYQVMFLIRRFEETVLENFSSGAFSGTTHTYLGQEADAAGVLAHLHPEDIVVSNHRCHGHFMAYGGDPHALFAELMGRATGVCGGRGGSQHLHWRNFYSNGILGGTAPMATGMALAEKLIGMRSLVVAFMGDGTLGEGVVYESFNMAALWQAPILYVVEDNGIAQTTPSPLGLAGRVTGRFAAFGIPVIELDSSDVLDIWKHAGEILEEIRSQGGPRALVIHTCRFGPHSKGDDTRPQEQIDAMRSERDPLKIHAQRLAGDKVFAIEAEVEAQVQQAYETALTDPLPAGRVHQIVPGGY
jgi:TPP-dependent pyruvate/acetoin dehydrogenase alpha subunit